MTSLVVDLQHVDLRLPRALRDCGPLPSSFSAQACVLGEIVVFAAVGLIDGVVALLLGGNAAGTSRRCPRAGWPPSGRLGRVLPSRVVLVGVHATARSVDDEHAALAGLRQHLVHARSHLASRRTALRQWCESHMSQTMIAVSAGFRIARPASVRVPSAASRSCSLSVTASPAAGQADEGASAA